MNKLWSEDKKRKNAEKVISEILPYVKENGIAYSPIIKIAIRELGASASNGLKENLILETLVKAKSENQSSVDHFERIYREVEAKWKKRLNMEASTWDLIIPFDVKIRKRKLKLLKTEFVIRSKLSLRKKYQQSVFASGANRNFTIEALPDFSIQTKVKALDIHKAWKKIENVYDLL